jgi:hypothetical protein
MKKGFAAVMLAGALVSNASAQILSPESFGGALWGSLLGGVIGGNCHDGFSGSGAAIGAGVGFLAGTIVGEQRRREASYYYSTAYQYPDPNSPYVYYAPNPYVAPGYYYRPAPRPNYAIGGTLVGAASGAMIGAGSDQAGKGALIGAVSGLVLGGVAEAVARDRERKLAAQPPPPPPSAPQPQAQPAPTVAAPPRAAPPAPPAPAQAQPAQAPARATHHFTAVQQHQIPDAPRVPDAPTF